MQASRRSDPTRPGGHAATAETPPSTESVPSAQGRQGRARVEEPPSAPDAPASAKPLPIANYASPGLSAVEELAAPLGRLVHRQRVNWLKLAKAPSRNTYLLIATGMMWTIPIAFTEPYRGLFYSRLGLSNSAIGMLMGLDMGLRVFGMLLGGLVMARFGAKRTLIVGDILSWIVPTVLLALAREPWHVVLAACFFSLNAFSSVSYQCMIVDGMPERRRARSFTLLILSNVLPGAIFPGVAAWIVSRFDFTTAIRLLYAYQAVSMSIGITLRGIHVRDLARETALGAAPQLRAVFAEMRAIARIPAWRRIVPVLFLANFLGFVWGSYAGIYMTKELHLPDGVPGTVAWTMSIFICIGLWTIMPRIGRHLLRPALLAAFLVAAAGNALLFLHPGVPALLVLGAAQGIASSIVQAVMNTLLADAIPPAARTWGFGLSFAISQLGIGLGYPILGLVFTSSFALFPVFVIACNILLVLLAWRVWRFQDAETERVSREAAGLEAA